MIDALIAALQTTLEWQGLLLIVIGTMLGMIFGMIPGLSGAVAIAIMIPLTFSMGLREAMLLLLSTLGGSALGGAISAILIGVPGTSVNAATVFDGHELARQGRADYAIGAAAGASAFGAFFGLLVLILSLPILVDVLLLFGPAEVFMLTFFGLTVIAIAVEGSFLAGLLSGMLGILLSFHGFVTVVGGERFTFGSNYLWDGIPLVPVFIGLFAVAGGIELLLDGGRVLKGDPISVSGRSARTVMAGVLSVFRHPRAFFIGSLTGVVIGIIPGVGGAVANMLAYTLVRNTAPDPETYGKGNVAGVIASETSNDAKDGGALMPTLALGIPGSEVMAILLGAFVLHGIQPGRAMLVDHLDVVWTIILALVFSNFLVAVVGVSFAAQLVKLTRIPAAIYAPSIVCVSLAGAYALHLEMLDVILALVFGLLGLTMKRLGYSRVALIIGLMLGGATEEAFFQAIQVSRGSYLTFFERPLSLSLALLTTAVVVYGFRRGWHRSGGNGAGRSTSRADN